jgi:hypothetical protein
MGKEGAMKVSAMLNLDSLDTSATKLEWDRGDRKPVNTLAGVSKNFNFRTGWSMRIALEGRIQIRSRSGKYRPSASVPGPMKVPILHFTQRQITAMQSIA